jgi:hypothetical protein
VGATMARINELHRDKRFVSIVYEIANTISQQIHIELSPRMYFNQVPYSTTDEQIQKMEQDVRNSSEVILNRLHRSGLTEYTQDDVNLFIEEDVLAGL